MNFDGSSAPLDLARDAIALMSGYASGHADTACLGAGAVLALVVGALAARSGRGVALALCVAVAVGLTSWALGFARIAGAARPIETLVRYNGLMIQMPLFCLSGFGLVQVWRDPAYAPLRAGATAGAIFGVLALAFGVATGSALGVHFGPRVLLPALPAVMALAITAARGDGGSAAIRLRRVAFVALAIAGLASSGLATRLLYEQKAEAERLAATLRAMPHRHVVTAHPFLPQQLASLWHERPMLYVASDGALRGVVRGLRRHGATGFALVVPPATPVAPASPDLSCRVVARHRGRRVHYLDVDVQQCDLGATGARRPSRGGLRWE